MAVMILLIVINLAVMGLIMWLIMREPHREYKGNHPFVVAEREERKRLESVQPAAPEIEKTENA